MRNNDEMTVPISVLPVQRSSKSLSRGIALPSVLSVTLCCSATTVIVLQGVTAVVVLMVVMVLVVVVEGVALVEEGEGVERGNARGCLRPSFPTPNQNPTPRPIHTCHKAYILPVVSILTSMTGMYRPRGR